MATPAAAAGNALAQVDVTNHTSETQNTLTLGTDSRTNIGGALVLGGAGGAGGLNAGSGGGTGGTNNNTSVTQNTTTLGNNAVLHYGSGRRPARRTDYEEFYNSREQQLVSIFRTEEYFYQVAANDGDGGLLGYRFNPRPGVNSWKQQPVPSLYDRLVAQWNSYFGNSVAFPGQPIN